MAPDQTVTIVDSRVIRAGCEKAFEAWADEMSRLARAAPGFQAMIRLGQTAGFQHLLLRFDDRAAASAWQAAPATLAHFAKANAFSTALRQVDAGADVAFDLPGDASASKWKRFLVTWVAVFPILLLLSLSVRVVLKGAPPVLQLLPSSLMLTAILQWLILPRLQRYTRTWVLKGSTGQLKT